MATILLFSLASLGAATSQSVLQLLLWRALLGIGMGGEWASGAVLISETWPPAASQQGDQHHAVGLGDRLHRRGADGGADPRAGPALGPEAWRWLFVVGVAAGAVHALDPAQRPRADGVDARAARRARRAAIRSR